MASSWDAVTSQPGAADAENAALALGCGQLRFRFALLAFSPTVKCERVANPGSISNRWATHRLRVSLERLPVSHYLIGGLGLWDKTENCVPCRDRPRRTKTLHK